MFLSIWHGSSYPNRGKNAHIMHCSTSARESRDKRVVWTGRIKENDPDLDGGLPSSSYGIL